MIKFIPVMNATIFVTIQKDVPTFLWVKAISTKVCVWVAQLMLLAEQKIVDSHSLKWEPDHPKCETFAFGEGSNLPGRMMMI